MSESKLSSTFFFVGKLSDHSAKYYVSNLEINRDLVFEVMLDNISIWGHSVKDFNDFFPEIREVLNILVSAFVFKNRKPLSYTIESWVESKNTISKSNMLGWVLNTHGEIKCFPRRSKSNTGWKKAVYFYKNIKKLNNNHILALKDYRSSLTDSSEDVFFLAYGAIEDICRATTGVADIDENAWQSMHSKLNTSKSLIDPLVSVVIKIRHGDKNDPLVIQSKSKRKELVAIAHQIIEKEYKRILPKF